MQNRNSVCLYWSGYYTPCTHQRDPTTAGRGHFELLDVSPGPNRISLGNLATPGSPRVSMLTPSLVRTPVQRVTKCSRTPVLKPSSSSTLAVASITGLATDPRWRKEPNFLYIKLVQTLMSSKTTVSTIVLFWQNMHWISTYFNNQSDFMILSFKWKHRMQK